MERDALQRPPHGEMLVVALQVHVGDSFPAHRHEHHQLVWASSGVLSVDADGTRWTLAPNLALWVPAGVEHATSASRPASMFGVYLRPRFTAGWTSPTLVSVTPLLRELFLHLTGRDLDDDTRRRAEHMVVDLLRPVDVTPLSLPVPSDPRARSVADALLASPADDRSLDAWAADVGASVRTLSRLFLAETGMGFSQWRTQARLRAALPGLAAGATVRSVARSVGYDTESGFVAAFRRATGRTPATYFASAERSCGTTWSSPYPIDSADGKPSAIATGKSRAT
ncbi:AraC family transcriptional regulator [Pseudonocardia sulfidoxydans NBRC 16205]|uniref:HTH-type transcriptional regulator RipA n=2 Tax=Pseudonocardia sulfidoxydans TaxID=54011 RepID=A0A511DP87_9PSEU|nr:AraC family transcriptional regulator [Pseudonocardia sulfidoxydans NBRC 16205]